MINLHLHRRDRGAPCSAFNRIVAVCATRDVTRRGFKTEASHSAEGPDGLAGALLLADGDIVARHEAVSVALVSYLNMRQPLDVGDAEPSGSNQSQGEAV